MNTAELQIWRNALRDDRELKARYGSERAASTKLVLWALAARWPDIRPGIRCLTDDCAFGSKDRTLEAIDRAAESGWLTYTETRGVGRVYKLAMAAVGVLVTGTPSSAAIEHPGPVGVPVTMRRCTGDGTGGVPVTGTEENKEENKEENNCAGTNSGEPSQPTESAQPVTRPVLPGWFIDHESATYRPASRARRKGRERHHNISEAELKEAWPYLSPAS